MSGKCELKEIKTDRFICKCGHQRVMVPRDALLLTRVQRIDRLLDWYNDHSKKVSD